MGGIRARLTDGRLTRIVCFGDSITGTYYHTGSQRAWCDMLGFALQKANPNANLQMINAGISGNTTVDALARIEQDVIAKHPHLVVIMFGMNDVTRVPLQAYQRNLREIIERCQHAGAAVLLCTPNGVSANNDRPEQTLALYAQAVKQIAGELTLPVVDCLDQWQTVRSEDPLGWSLLMSDAIHPNMNGHRRLAELMAMSICGRTVSLHDVSPPLDTLHHTFDRLSRNEVVKVVAMPPYDRLVPDQLQRHFPRAKLEVSVWPTENRSLPEIVAWSKQIRSMQPHLVIPAVPLPSLGQRQETFIAEYEWALNWSFPFAGRSWDVLPIMPLDPATAPQALRITALERENLANARSTLLGKDIRFIERDMDDDRSVVDIVSAWVTDQKRAWQGARNVLPAKNAPVLIPVQSWPHHPGPRTARISLHYPGGLLTNVNAQTGIMLTLHNWGGRECEGTANPETLANRLNVIGVCVNYLQSGRGDALDAAEPYDCGYLQALDALRALAYVRSGLQQAQVEYDDGRLFCTGGSGGGNVTLMANKLAPRTFACIIDVSGMTKLSDDIAFNLPGGSRLNARWRRDDNQSRNYLSTDAQAIRSNSDPTHLAVMKSLGTSCKIIVVHGKNDTTCPFAEAKAMVENLQAADFDVEPHFIDQARLDDRVFTDTGHALGDRTKIVLAVAEKYLKGDSPQAVRRLGPPDFDRRERLHYPTENGQYEISYDDGIPRAKFRPRRYRWNLATTGALWQPRDSQGEVVFDDRLWIFGGWFDSYSAPPRDVWNCSDGRGWKLVTQEAPWLHSDLSMSLAFKDRMWMMGGWFNGRLPGHSASNSVWSSTDGSRWKQETTSAGWSPRLAAAVVKLKDRMWLLGGTENYYFGNQESLKNDVWSSQDGRHWQRATDHAPWAPRAYHQAVVLQDRIYVLGGGNYLPEYQAFNDVWSSANGVDWRKETATAPWRERLWFSSVVYRDHIWVLGGWSKNPADNLGDVWYSKNGRDWKQLHCDVIWTPRHEHSAFVFQDRIWIAGGHARPLSNEVWSLQLPPDWGTSR